MRKPFPQKYSFNNFKFMVLCLETSISPHNIHIGKIDHIPIFIDKMYELIIKRISNINLNIVSISYFKILN